MKIFKLSFSKLWSTILKVKKFVEAFFMNSTLIFLTVNARNLPDFHIRWLRLCINWFNLQVWQLLSFHIPLQTYTKLMNHKFDHQEFHILYFQTLIGGNCDYACCMSALRHYFDFRTTMRRWEFKGPISTALDFTLSS